MKLHIGGKQAKEGWKILNIQEGADVDYLGTCTNLSALGDTTVDTIYASHVYEHLGYTEELPLALKEAQRVLVPGGKLLISVPNFGVLCQLFVAEGLSIPQRHKIMRMIFGGQTDNYDYHKVGLIEEFLKNDLGKTGFTGFERVETFNLFDDASSMRLGGHLISLNVVATK